MMKKFFRRKMAWVALVLVAAGGITLYAYRTDDRYFEIARNLDIFAAVYRDLNAYYVDDIRPEEVMNTGIAAMTESLDPYTTYYSENNLDDLKFQTTGRYAGIGASIRQEGDWLVISDVYEGSPVQKAGIKPGDIIDSLDNRSMKGATQDQASNLLKGKPGSTLEMSLRNPFTNATFRRKITRQEINMRSVVWSGMVDDVTGYIRLQQFTENSSNDTRKAFDSLKAAHPGIKGLVLDLRGNPGGLLEEAVKIANIFVDAGKTIVSTRGRVQAWNRTYKTTAYADDDTVRVAILINRMSASASEIVAGAIQDLDRGVIIGQRSFGKGLVQTTHNLPYNARLKLTTAKYYTPSGRCIQAIDYSHRDDDGSVAYIPDSLRKSFKTADGRKVLDGGGIEPDIKIAPGYLSGITVSLLNKNYIFDFATQYYYKHPSIAPAGTFSLRDTDFNDFKQFLAGKNYDYKTGSEEALEVFEEVAKKEKYFKGVKTAYDALKNEMQHDKMNDLDRNRDEIIRLLEGEIANRYYPQIGRVQVDLKTDQDLQQAIAVLDNAATYQDIINGKQSAPPLAAGK